MNPSRELYAPAVPHEGLDGVDKVPILGPSTDLGQSSKLLTMRAHLELPCLSSSSPFVVYLDCKRSTQTWHQAQQRCRNAQRVSLPQVSLEAK